MTLTAAETVKKLRACKLCEHTYLTPCHGKDKTCMNGLWVRSGRNTKKYNQMRKELGLGEQRVIVEPKPGKTRTRIVEDSPKPKGKKRVRL